jgi:hypothetical protein
LVHLRCERSAGISMLSGQPEASTMTSRPQLQIMENLREGVRKIWRKAKMICWSG